MILPLQEAIANVTKDVPRSGECVRRYSAVRAETERLAAALSPEDQCVQSMPDASPAKWHRAHTTWFFETFILAPHVRGYRFYDPQYNYLFNSYYETVGRAAARDRRGLLTRPSADEVSAYRRHVDRLCVSSGSPQSRGRLASSLARAATRAATSGTAADRHCCMPLRRIRSCRPMCVSLWGGGKTVPVEWTTSIRRRRVAIGHSGEGFAFDNEMPRHEVMSRRPACKPAGDQWRMAEFIATGL